MVNFSKTGAMARAGSIHLEASEEIKVGIARAHGDVREKIGDERKVENWIGDGCCLRLERFEDQQEAWQYQTDRSVAFPLLTHKMS